MFASSNGYTEIHISGSQRRPGCASPDERENTIVLCTLTHPRKCVVIRTEHRSGNISRKSRREGGPTRSGALNAF